MLSPRTISACALAIGLLGASAMGAAAQGVGSDADTITVALDGSGDHASIPEAIAAADAGSIVLVSPGTYERMLSIPADVTLTAVVPVGYPKGRFGSVSRPPARRFVSWDRYAE